jgi:hypothetical protein
MKTLKTIINEGGKLARTWQKAGNKRDFSIKDRDIELRKNSASGAHEILKGGKLIGNFTIDKKTNNWQLNLIGQKGQQVDSVDDVMAQAKKHKGR